MGDHLLFCSDLARRPPGCAITRIEGWCFASKPIAALYLHRSGRDYEQVPYGFERADVGQVHPQYSSAPRSGFRFSTSHEIAAGALSQLLVEISHANGTPELHRISVQLETRDVQTIELDGVTRREATGAEAELQEASAVETRLRRSLDKRPGLTLRLDIINKCNLRCVMCHFSDDAIFRRPTSQFSGEQFKAFFDEIGPSVRRVMLSCGDEPLTSKFLPEILRYLADQHPHVGIAFCTNAMLMNAPVRELIMATRVERLLFSIDAVSKRLLESIRIGCRYDQLVGNIIALRDLKERHRSDSPAFVFNFVMMNRNIHEGPAFVGMAKALGAEAIDFRHVVPDSNYSEPEQLLSGHKEKYNYYRDQIVAATKRLGVECCLPPSFETIGRWSPVNEPQVDMSDFERVVTQEPSTGSAGSATNGVKTQPAFIWEGTVTEEFLPTFCHRPFSEIMIRDQDEVLPCPWHGKTLGRLSEGRTLSEIFLGDDFARLRLNMLKPEGDPGCAHCPIKSGHLPTDAA